jgi:DNA-damage-inducible protein D
MSEPDTKPEPSGNQGVFRFDEGCLNFEDLGHDNGFRYWFATDLARCLEYGDFQAFRRGPLNKAMATCATLGIPHDENFISCTKTVGGVEIPDCKMSRFACYLTAMNGDNKKPRVAEARAYFAAVAASFQKYLEDANDIERLTVRDEITGKERSLGAVAQAAGVVTYGYFHNAGYRGMYNMNLSELKNLKMMPANGRCLLDYMGKSELAANLFRITQTEDKIRNQNIHGQRNCEQAAETVGRTVRKTMQEISGTAPEDLPLEGSIHDVRKNIKHAQKEFKRLESK